MNLDLNKIVESFNKLNDQARYSVLVGFVFLIILLDVLLLVLPQIGAIGNVNDQIKKLSDDTQEVLVDRDRVNVLRKNLQDERLQLSSLSSKVRAVQEVPAILSTISSIANEFGVKIDQLVPEKSQQEVLRITPDGKYYGLPVVIKARCGYHKFGHFLNTLENEDLSFIVKDFIIQNDEKDSRTHLFSLTINIILVDRSWVQAKNL
jgi:Tfp pilus assembly protein PilO